VASLTRSGEGPNHGEKTEPWTQPKGVCTNSLANGQVCDGWEVSHSTNYAFFTDNGDGLCQSQYCRVTIGDTCTNP